MRLKLKINPAGLIRRNKIPPEELDKVRCKNCDFEFQGHYCPNCGQAVAEFNRPFGFILYDFAGNFFAFDTRFFLTFWYLFSRPGFLTLEFFKGRRVKYSLPFRIFVFLSFVLFLLLQTYSERSLDKLAEVNITRSENQLIIAPEVTINSKVSLSDTLQNDTQSAQSLNSDSLQQIVGLDFLGPGSLRDKLNKLGDKLELELAKEEDQVLRKKLSTAIAMCRSPELGISKILKYLSWAFFLLLPVFALILKLFYIRQNQFYIRHLIFSIHLHSFFFFILIIVIGLNLFIGPQISVVSGLLIATFPVYTILALRKFYGQSIGKILLKFIGLTIIYNFLLWATVIFVFLKSLGII